MKKLIPIIIAISLLAACSHSTGRTGDLVKPQQPPKLTPETQPPASATPAPPATKAPAPAQKSQPAPTQPKPPQPPVSTETSVKVISVTSGNLFFKPATINLKLNEPVKLNITNTGGHTFTVDELGVDVPLTGSFASASFTPKKKGTFQIYCAVPGHKQAGMVGTLVVE